ncbi:MAG: hypothetical protein OWS03_02875 [Alicyclobacillaceae bacterium]|nr:hypothetical protein [Alicyclobacillaceae bacterium]
MAFNVAGIINSPLFQLVREVLGIVGLVVLVVFAVRIATHFSRARRSEIILEAAFGIVVFMFLADPAFLLTLASYGAGLLIDATKGL